jgi:hypothetical protein
MPRLDHDQQLLTNFFAEFVELFLPDANPYLDLDSIEFLDEEVFTEPTGGERGSRRDEGFWIRQTELDAKTRMKREEDELGVF